MRTASPILVFILSASLASAQTASTPAPAAAASPASPYVDALIVLGAGSAPEGWANPILVQRVCRAAIEYRQGRASKIIVSGGYTSGHISEAEMMRLAAAAMGIPPEEVLMESSASNTVENAVLSTRIAVKNKWKKVALVSSKSHFPRATQEFQKAGAGFFESVEEIYSDGTSSACFQGEAVRPAPGVYDLLIVDLARERPLSDIGAEPTVPLPGLLRGARRAASWQQAGYAKRIYFALPAIPPSPGNTYATAEAPFSTTESARVLAAAMGVPWDAITISSGRRDDGIAGAVEPTENFWLRIPNARIGIAAPAEHQAWWRQRFQEGPNALLAPPEFLEP